MGRARGFDPPLGARAHCLPIGHGVALPRSRHRPARGVGNRHRARCHAVLLRVDTRARESLPRSGRRDPGRRARSQPAAAEPHTGRDPPADALPRLRRLHDPVRVRGRRVDHRSLRRGLARGRAAHDAHRVGSSHRRDRARRVVELRGPRVGRLLGMGPGRERIAPPVAHGHRVHPLRDGAGTARHVARLEPLARARDLLPHDPRHVPHPVRCRHVGAQLHAVADRAVAADVPRRRRRRLRGVDRVAGRRTAFARPHRLAGVARSRVPDEQPPLRRLRARRTDGHGVPAARGSVAEPDAVGRRALLRTARCPHRDRAALPDGGRTALAVARREQRAPAQATPDPRLGGRDHARRRACCSVRAASRRC